MLDLTNCLNWLNKKNKSTKVDIRQILLSSSDFWFYDISNSCIINRKNSFFSIYGAEFYYNDKFISEQPIIIQDEIGYLGIICKLIDGIPYFLMQAKIEPGNINVVQISPTIQATKSNFTRSHGGILPNYFNIFEQCKSKDIIYDQIQSEQSTRFLKKFNRNIIIKIDDEIEKMSDFEWISYPQLMELMKIDNLVNMDTRTVISGMPFDLIKDNLAINNYWLKSIYSSDINKELKTIFHRINNLSMFDKARTIIKPLNELREWNVLDDGIYCKLEANFEVKYFDINIEGREVHSWTQPLFCSKGSGLFGIFIKLINGEYKILVKIRRFIGSNNYEISPTVQLEFNELNCDSLNDINNKFINKMNSKNNIMVDVVLSEEGGRFYHEQNRNVIILLDEDLHIIDNDYVFVSLGTLKQIIKMTNYCNIQLRNLISLINIFEKYED